MRKLITLALLGLFVLSFGACGSDSDSGSSDGDFYTVTFKRQDETVWTTVTVPAGKSIGNENFPSEPPDKVVPPRRFAMWHTDINGVNGDSLWPITPVTGNLTVYVIWWDEENKISPGC